MTPLKPDQPLAVTLEAQQWNVVINALMDVAWRFSDPVLRKITQQIEQVQADEATSVSPSLPVKPNGADEHVSH